MSFYNTNNDFYFVFLINYLYICIVIVNQRLMDKRLFDAQLKAAEVQGLLAHIAKNVNYKQDLEEPATRNIDVINATLSEVCQMLEKLNQELTNQ